MYFVWTTGLIVENTKEGGAPYSQEWDHKPRFGQYCNKT